MLRIAPLLLALTLTACAGAPEEPSGEAARQEEAPMGSVIVTLQEIDPAGRVVTVSDAAGHTRTFKVDERAGPLDAWKPGDRLRMDYYEAIVVELVKPAEEGAQDALVVEAAPPEALPEGASGRSVTTDAVVEAIDASTSVLTLRLEDGACARMKPRHPERLASLKVGDRLRLTYAEALAVALQRAEPAEAR